MSNSAASFSTRSFITKKVRPCTVLELGQVQDGLLVPVGLSVGQQAVNNGEGHRLAELFVLQQLLEKAVVPEEQCSLGDLVVVALHALVDSLGYSNAQRLPGLPKLLEDGHARQVGHFLKLI